MGLNFYVWGVRPAKPQEVAGILNEDDEEYGGRTGIYHYPRDMAVKKWDKRLVQEHISTFQGEREEHDVSGKGYVKIIIERDF